MEKNKRGDECSMGDGCSRGMGVPGGMSVPGGWEFQGDECSRGMSVLRTFLNVWINANNDYFPCESVYLPLLCNDG